MAIKVHFAVNRERFGEQRVRSLCGRSSQTVWNVETIEVGQNVSGDREKVTCTFCRRLLIAQDKLRAA